MDRKPGRITLVGQYNGEPEVKVSDTNGTIVTTAIISGLTAGALTVAAQPDYPRTLMAFLTDANATITGATVTIVGLDQNGEGITDILTITAAGAVEGVKAFSKVTSATWALVSGTVTATDDTVAIGFGARIGLPSAPGATIDRVISSIFDDAPDAGTFYANYGTYIPAGTMNGAKHLELTYLFSVPVVTY